MRNYNIGLPVRVVETKCTEDSWLMECEVERAIREAKALEQMGLEMGGTQTKKEKRIVAHVPDAPEPFIDPADPFLAANYYTTDTYTAEYYEPVSEIA